jgi:CheY-like chemotaxis protein
MTIGIFIVFALICFVADLAVRTILERIRAQRRRREREQALAESVRLDFSSEARSLQRVEVANPVARILCVDDEEIILDSFRKILVLDGYSVDTVQTGPEALGLIQKNHYDFVFTDLRMPAMDGVEVAKSVRHMRPDIDVVIITGFATVETAVECMKYGAMDYVQKPFTEEELRAFVKKVLIRRQDQIEKRLKPKIHITHGPADATVRPGEFFIPGGVWISPGHCWAGLAQDGSVMVGLDDFAKKLIGRVDAVEMPAPDATLNAGEPLFAIRQGARRIQFFSPVSGRVVKINQSLAKLQPELDVTTYHNHWVCVISGEKLDAEIPALKIGKAAVALFQEDLARFTAFMHDTAKAGPAGEVVDEALCIGALANLNDEQWTRAAGQFFGRSG